jgi:hypothetical protein
MTATMQDVRKLMGHDVMMRLKDGEGGSVLRWGTLAAMTADSLIVDDYHDSAGIGAYLPPRGCNVRDQVPIGFDEVVSVERNWHVVV